MKGKAFQGRKRLHMLNDLTSSAKCVEVKRAAEDQERWRAINRREYHKPATQQNTRRRSRTELTIVC